MRAYQLPVSGRSVKGERQYQKAKANGETIDLDLEPAIKSWKWWRLIENAYPYDTIFKTHHMLLPKRIVSDRFWLEPEEVLELDEILTEVKNDYDLVFENFPKRRSVMAHYHLHLAVWHDNRKDMKL